MKINFKILSCAALVAASTPAFAVDVMISGFSPAGSGPLTINYPSGFLVDPYNTTAGQMTGTVGGSSFLTYCADIFQVITFGNTYTDYSINMPWTVAQQTNMNKLISYALGNGLPANAAQSAAMQAAVWEVLYETSPFQLGAGDAGVFKVNSGDAAVQTALNTFNWAAVAAQPITHIASNLASITGQDLLLITPVPETGTYAMMLLGLAGLGVHLRRQAAKG